MPRPKAYWIRLDQGVHDHPKTIAVALALGVSRETIVGHLTRLWLWASVYRPFGRTEGIPDGVLAEASGWKGDPASWREQLRVTRFLTQSRHGEQLRGWTERNAYRINESARKVESARLNRARLARDMRTNSAPTDVRYVQDVQKEKTKTSARQKPASSPAPAVLEELRRFEELCGHKANPSVPRAVAKLIEAGKGAELIRARERYARELNAKDTPREFRILPHNWYGRAARWTEYTGPAPAAPARKPIGDAYRKPPGARPKLSEADEARVKRYAVRRRELLAEFRKTNPEAADGNILAMVSAALRGEGLTS